MFNRALGVFSIIFLVTFLLFFSLKDAEATASSTAVKLSDKSNNFSKSSLIFRVTKGSYSDKTMFSEALVRFLSNKGLSQLSFDVYSLATDDYVVHFQNNLADHELDQVMQGYRDFPGILSIYLDTTFQSSTIQVDDPLASSQWNLFGSNSINVEKAWEYSVGNDTSIAIIDSGVVQHPDLDNKLISGYDFISDPNSARDGDGRDPHPNDEGDWFDEGECGQNSSSFSSWHGTHIAGVAAAESDNGIGIAGISPFSKIQPIRVLGKCGGVVSDLVDAIIWAAGGSVAGIDVNDKPADVINLSFTGRGQCSPVLQDAIDFANEHGSIVVAAAGNDAEIAENFQPANCRNIVVVGSSNHYGGLSTFSNFGSKLDLVAPGGDFSEYSTILSTSNVGMNAPSSFSYGSDIGTSISAASVSATIALMKSVNPHITLFEVEDIFSSTSFFLNEEACPTGCGSGRLDSGRAIEEAKRRYSLMFSRREHLSS